jgi:hypothetical protein
MSAINSCTTVQVSDNYHKTGLKSNEIHSRVGRSFIQVIPLFFIQVESGDIIPIKQDMDN